MENRLPLRIVRNDQCVAWGFRISGGRDFGAPVTIQRVNPSSVADRHGLMGGDLLITIDGCSTSEMKHSEVQMKIKNAEKVLNLEVERREKPPSSRPVPSTKDVTPTLSNLKISGTAMEQPASGTRGATFGSSENRYASQPQPYQAVTVETTLQLPKETKHSEPVVHTAPTIQAPMSSQARIQLSGRDNRSASPVRLGGQVNIEVNESRPPTGQVGFQTSSPHFDRNNVDPPTTPAEDQVSQPSASVPVGYRSVSPAQGTPPPPPAPTANRPALLEPESPSVRTPQVVGALSLPAPSSESRSFGAPPPPPPTVAPKPFSGRKSSGDSGFMLSGGSHVGAQPWKAPNERKGSLDVAVSPSHTQKTVSGELVPERKTSWDKSATLPSGQSYSAQPWKPPQVQEERKSSWDKSATLPPSQGYSAQPWKPPQVQEERKSSWDKSATLPPSQGYSAQPWKPPTPPEEKRPSIDASASLPHSQGHDSQNWRPTEGNRQAPWNKSNSHQQSLEDRRPSGSGEQKKKHEAGICFHCKEAIRGPYLMALDRVYCSDHFRCFRCDCRLDKQPFIKHENNVYCQDDYGKYIAEKCAVCSLPIITDCLRAMDKAYHPECFTCTMCRKPIAPGNFRLGSDNKPYCDEDWKANFQVMCTRCDFPIEPDERFIEALNQSFHAECFACVTCNLQLEGKPFYNRNDRPYCREHVPAH